MLSRFRRDEDGSIAVLAAVTVPVVLLCVALAFAAIVWSSSEHEAQRAADQAAVRSAATAFLGTDFPYAEMPGLGSAVSYPDVDALAGVFGLTPPADLSECGTVGLPPEVVDGAPTIPNGASLATSGVSASAGVGGTPTSVPPTLELPADCVDVGPYAPPVALGDTDQSRAVACATAKDGMSPDQASYANDFYKGSGDSQPSCDNNRVGVKLSTGSPLVGFGTTAWTAATGTLDATVAPETATVQAALAALGIRLDSSMPSLMCPEISVTIDQPVREPVFDGFSMPNGRATARRIVKNAVVVPVYNGHAISAVTNGTASASASGVGVDVSLSNGTTVTIPPQNLNSLLIAQQKQLLTLLDEVDAIADATLRALNVSVTALNGTLAGIDPTAPQPAPTAASGPLESLRLTKCLRDTMTQIYDPPAGDAPTADEVLAQAAESGEQIMLVQVGAVEAACTEAGAISVPATVEGAPDCIRAATTPQVNPLTGVYEVPFFDVTPAIVQDIGDQNYAAVPLHASQASGAFRGGLVRDKANTRYDPDVRQPVPTSACDMTIPAATPDTACEILSITPSPVTTPTPTISATTLLPTIPVPTVDPSSPVPTVDPSSIVPTVLPTVSPSCVVLCGGFP